MAKLVSTSSLAKRLGLPTKALFERLVNTGYLLREGDRWVLLPAGQRAGGQRRHSDKYGDYVVWPETLAVPAVDGLLSLSALADRIRDELGQGDAAMGPLTLRALLCHLGWLAPGGERVTEAGLAVGGVMQVDPASGEVFSLWPEGLLKRSDCKRLIGLALGINADASSTHKSVAQFRSQFDAKYLTLDHHYVRSRADLRLDNWLYLNGYAHGYEPSLPFGEDLRARFYLPAHYLYLEFSERFEPDALAERLKAYQQNGCQVMLLSEGDLDQLDTLIPKRLRLLELAR